MTVLSRLKLSGFRGSQKTLELSITKSMILLGQSGSGKTTLLQAIEWGLFGKISGFKGHGFTSEDAYVNLFKEDSRASVELDLRLSNGTSFFVKRDRTRAKKSTIGTTSLKAWSNGASYSGKEAQNKIEALLGLDHERFTQAIFLHQDMIRKFVEGEPKDRSDVIDQLLGLKALREFTEALDPKRRIRNEIKVLRGVKENLENQKIGFRTENHETLIREKERLIGNGYKESELKIEYVNDQVSSLIDQMTKLSQLYDSDSTLVIENITNVERAKNAIKQIKSSTLTLDRTRSNQRGENQGRQIRIEGLLKQLDQMRSQTRNRLSRKHAIHKAISEISNKITANKKQLRELHERTDDIDPLLRDFDSLSSLYNDRKASLTEIAKDSNEHKALIKQRKENSRRIGKLRVKITQEDSLAQVLSSAYSYISETESKDCPICKQRIEPKTVLNQLKLQNKTTGTRLGTIKKAIEDLEKKNRELDSSLSKWETTREELASLEAEMTKRIQRIREITLIDDTSYEKAETFLNKSRKQIRDLENKMIAQESRRTQLEKEETEIAEAGESVQKIEKDLRDLIPNLSSCKADEFDDSVRSHLGELRSRTDELRRTEPIDSIREKVEAIEQVVEYLSTIENVDRKIGEESKIDEEIDNLNYKIVQLDNLETSLKLIQEAVSEHQNELVNKTLENLQASIEYYYNRLIGHPFFKKVRIRPLLEEPVAYEVVAYDEEAEHETHINTRFSTAQANATALALFFAINEKLALDFPLLILDDPTQNMDQIYQTALAETLKTLSGNRQLLVATHENEFSNQLASELESKIELLQMNEWTVEGPNPQTVK